MPQRCQPNLWRSHPLDTTGGILGRIIEVNDTFVTLEIADGVRIKVQKTQITQLMPKGTLKSA